MATGIPFGWTVQDANGAAVSGAKIYFYIPNTTTFRTPYTDSALTTSSANPVVADSAGYVLVYLSSELAYDIVVKSANDAITYQSRTVASNISGAQPVDATLTALAGLVVEDGDFIQATGSDSFRKRKVTVATYAALTAIAAANRFDDMLVYVSSRAADGDGGEGWWRFDASSSASADGGTILAPDAGTGRWIRQGIADGVFQYTWFATVAAAFASAFDVLELPEGNIALTDRITHPTGKVVRGKGRRLTTFTIDAATFNMSATSVYRMAETGSDVLSELSGVGFVFTQPDTATRGSLNAYPPCISARSAPRVKLRDIYITKAITGIDLEGNSGGAIIDTCEICAFDNDILLDGALDTIRGLNLQCWPFALTSNQLLIYDDGKHVRIGYCDDFHFTDCLFFGKKASVVADDLGTGMGYGTFTGCTWDSLSGVQVLGDAPGQGITFSGCRWSIGNTGVRVVTASGNALVNLIGCEFSMTGSSMTDEQIQVNDTAVVNMIGGLLNASSVADIKLAAVKSSTAFLHMDGVTLNRNPNGSTYSSVFVDFGTGSGSFTNTRLLNARGTSTGTILSADIDKVEVSGNRANGWTWGAADGWKTWTPTISALTGTLTTTSVNYAEYSRAGDKVNFRASITVTSAGTGAGALQFTLPATPSVEGTFIGTEVASTGNGLNGRINATSATALILTYNNADPIGNGRRYVVEGQFAA